MGLKTGHASQNRGMMNQSTVIRGLGLERAYCLRGCPRTADQTHGAHLSLSTNCEWNFEKHSSRTGIETIWQYHLELLDTLTECAHRSGFCPQEMQLLIPCCHISSTLSRISPDIQDRTKLLHELQCQGLYSLSGLVPYRRILWSLEAARLYVTIIVSPWKLTGISAGLMLRYLSNVRAIVETCGKTPVRLVNRGPGIQYHIKAQKFVFAHEIIPDKCTPQRPW